MVAYSTVLSVLCSAGPVLAAPRHQSGRRTQCSGRRQPI